MGRLSRAELVDRVRRIIEVDGTDEELEAVADEINSNVPYPDITELIYDEDETSTPEEIVERALSYRPTAIQLPAVIEEAEKPSGGD